MGTDGSRHRACAEAGGVATCARGCKRGSAVAVSIVSQCGQDEKYRTRNLVVNAAEIIGSGHGATDRSISTPLARLAA